MTGFQGPDALLQPVQQFQIIGHAPEKYLAEMDVALHESGQQQLVAGVYNYIGGAGIQMAYAAYAVIFYEKISA
jgi:hypothetical protein